MDLQYITIQSTQDISLPCEGNSSGLTVHYNTINTRHFLPCEGNSSELTVHYNTINTRHFLPCERNSSELTVHCNTINTRHFPCNGNSTEFPYFCYALCKRYNRMALLKGLSLLRGFNQALLQVIQIA